MQIPSSPSIPGFRTNLPGFAALVVLGLLAFAVARRRFRTGFVLLHAAVALGGRWSEARARARVGAVLASRAAAETEGTGSVSSSALLRRP